MTGPEVPFSDGPSTEDNPALAGAPSTEPTVADDAPVPDGAPVDALGRPASDNPDALVPAVTADELDQLDDDEPEVVTTEPGEKDYLGRELAPRVLLPAEVADRDAAKDDEPPAEVFDANPRGVDPNRL